LPKSPLRFTNRERSGLCLYSHPQFGYAAAHRLSGSIFDPITKNRTEEKKMNSKYTYKSVTGPIEIEVDAEWAEILAAEDKAEYNSERRHRRSDHKYAPGKPDSYEHLNYKDKRLADTSGCIEGVELSVDMERALMALTELQRRYFLMVHLGGYKYAEIARLEGKHKVTVSEIVEAARKKLEKILS